MVADPARFAVAVVDHFAARSGWRAVPGPSSAAGAWRRLYVAEGRPVLLAVVGSGDGRWASLGVEIEARRERIVAGLAELLAAVAPYEAAVDADAGADPHGPEAVVRVAVRVFLDGLTAAAFADAMGSVLAAAAEARKALDAP